MGAWMRLRPIGSCTTGRLLSGMDTKRGESARHSSCRPMCSTWATSRGSGESVDVGSAPDDDRGDHEARPRRVVVEPAQHVGGSDRETELFVDLAQRCGLDRFAVVESSAGQRPLPRVAVHLRRPTAQQERRATGHAFDRAVEAGGVARHAGHAELVGWVRLIVADDIAANDDDRNSCAWPVVGGDRVDGVACEIGDHPVAQADVELDHLRRPQRPGLPC